MKRIFIQLVALSFVANTFAQDRPSTVTRNGGLASMTDYDMPVKRILWQSETGVTNAQALLASNEDQAAPAEPRPPCELKPSAGILLDFGVELQGTVRIITPELPKTAAPLRVHVRFGESAMEAMAELKFKNAGNDHSIRDKMIELSPSGKNTFGPSGFRFVRIDNVNPDATVVLSNVYAVLRMQNVQTLGAFRCNDERLNRVWEVGAYTVKLCMQDCLMDGIKRDRAPWLGDMAPEVCTINSAFGFNDVVTHSVDGMRKGTPMDKWMNGIPSYSMWWVLIQEDMWMHHGERAYFEEQHVYLAALLKKFAGLVDDKGQEKIDGWAFIDWPTDPNKKAVSAGMHALLVLTLESGDRMMTALKDEETAKICNDAVKRMRQIVPDANGSKAVAALLSLAGLGDSKQISNAILKAGGAKGLSTFYGLFILQALTKTGDIDTALDFISKYWGAMLDFGATTFWEDFNIEWTENAGRIDELTPPGKNDIHGDFGGFCYVGYRHSLCHGWSSGPTPWLSRTVLGIQPVEPGFKRVRIVPQLGTLKWAEGSYPTPLGLIQVRHERQADGSMKSKGTIPPGMTVENVRSGEYEVTKYYKLSVAASNGVVQLIPADGVYALGSVVTVTAKPNRKYVFSGWGGDLSGTNCHATIKMDGDKSVTAAFTFGTEDYNIAMDGTATQSSIGYEGAVASRAIDGNTDGKFFSNSVTHTASDANAWWQVDLGDNYVIKNVKCFNRTDADSGRAADYDVQIGTDGSTWTTVSHQAEVMGSPTEIKLDGVTGRYVRIQLCSANLLTLAEVEVWGRPVSVAELKP
jgi:alpha-L-rhamnosidase